MNTKDDLNEEVLEHAVVQCLRLFAKHGRKIRCQQVTLDEKSSNSVTTEKEAKVSSDQEAGQK